MRSGRTGRSFHLRSRLPLWRRTVRDHSRLQRQTISLAATYAPPASWREFPANQHTLSRSETARIRNGVNPLERHARFDSAPDHFTRHRPARLLTKNGQHADNCDELASTACAGKWAANLALANE